MADTPSKTGTGKKTKKSEVPQQQTISRRERAEATKTKLRKKGIQVYSGRESHGINYLRRSTGLLGLDVCMAGGFGVGLTRIVGRDGLGKTSLAFLCLGAHQQRKGEDSIVAIVSTEGKLDKVQARRHGFMVAFDDEEIRRLEEDRTEPFSDEELKLLREEIGVVHIADEMQTAEEALDSTLELVKEGVYDIIVFDSWGALLTKPMAEAKSVADKHYGGASLTITQFMYGFWAAMNERFPHYDGGLNQTTFLVIDQMREDLGGMGSSKLLGGWAAKHGAICRLSLRAGPLVPKENPIGKLVRWRIDKGKQGFHDGPTGEVVYVFDSGFDVILDLVLTATNYGVIKLAGSFYSYEDQKFQGKEAVKNWLIDNPHMAERIRLETLKAAHIHCRY